MNASRTTIDLLCKVVDNFGDIGVVFRLARALHSVAPALRLRLVVDDLHAFSRVCPGIDPSLDIQSFSDWTVLRWSIPWHGLASAPPDVLVESFACGRPEWYERALSSIEAPRPRLIIDLEHLTAESYAEDMHLLDSLTALPLASKCLFFPGFSAKTGGLILDPSFMEARKLYADPVKRQSARQHLALRLGIGPTGSAAQRFWICLFSYEQDFRPAVAELAEFNRHCPLLVLCAPGRSQPCFEVAWEAASRPFPVHRLPFLGQELWDEVLLASDFSIVRGEDSLSRAVLSGRPFLWHAYLQDDRHQLVKVAALLDRLRPCFSPSDFAPVERVFLSFNDRVVDDCRQAGLTGLGGILRSSGQLGPAFAQFASRILSNGDLAAHLLTHMTKLGYYTPPELAG